MFYLDFLDEKGILIPDNFGDGGAFGQPDGFQSLAAVADDLVGFEHESDEFLVFIQFECDEHHEVCQHARDARGTFADNLDVKRFAWRLLP